MTAKEYLHQAYRLNDKIESNLRQVEALEVKATSVTVNFGEKVQSGERNSTEQTILKIIALKQRINEETDRYIDLLTEIRSTIDKVKDPDENLLLTLRYIEFMKWEEIMEKMRFSRPQVFRIYNNALKSIQINVTDVNIASRLKKCQKQIDEIGAELQGLKNPTPEQLSGYDERIKKLLDFAFGADISSHAFGDTSCLSPLPDGSLLLFAFMDAFVPAVLEDIKQAGSGFKSQNRARIEQYTAGLDEPKAEPTATKADSFDLNRLNEKQLAFLHSLQ